MLVRVIDVLDCRKGHARFFKMVLSTNNGIATISYLIPKEQSLDQYFLPDACHLGTMPKPEFQADKVYSTRAAEVVLAAEEFERMKNKLLSDSCLVMEKVIAKEKA